MSEIEWEMKYKALAASIDDEKYVKNAETLVRLTCEVAAHSGHAVYDVFDMMLSAVRSVSATDNAYRQGHAVGVLEGRRLGPYRDLRRR